MNRLAPQHFPVFSMTSNSDTGAKRIWYDERTDNRAVYLNGTGAQTIADFLGSDWEGEDHVDTEVNQTVWVGTDTWDTRIKPDNDLGYFRKKSWAPDVGITMTSYTGTGDYSNIVLYPIWKKAASVFGKGNNLGNAAVYGSRTDINVIKISDDTMLFYSYERRNGSCYPILVTRGYNKISKEWHDYICLIMTDYVRWIDATDGNTSYQSSDANILPRCVRSLFGDRGVMLAPFVLPEANQIEFPDVKMALFGYPDYNKLIKVKDRWYNTTVSGSGKNIYLDVTDYIQE